MLKARSQQTCVAKITRTVNWMSWQLSILARAKLIATVVAKHILLGI